MVQIGEIVIIPVSARTCACGRTASVAGPRIGSKVVSFCRECANGYHEKLAQAEKLSGNWIVVGVAPHESLGGFNAGLQCVDRSRN